MVYPAYVWSIPVGALIFTGAIAIDTIGHRTVYQAELQKYEALVHHITIFSGVTSVILLCAAYRYPVALYVPTLVLIGLSIFYSAVDEAIHPRPGRLFGANPFRPLPLIVGQLGDIAKAAPAQGITQVQARELGHAGEEGSGL